MSDTVTILLSFIYANESARIGAVGLIPDDIGKFAKQSDDSSYWELLNDFPVTWGALSTSTVNATDVTLSDVIVNGETRLSETVIRIQNIPVSPEVPTDGYSLVYDGYTNQWQPENNKYILSFGNVDLIAGILTVIHNLTEKYIIIQVYDNTDKMIIPDSVTLIDENSLNIDLTTFGVIVGVWNLVVQK